MQFTVKHVLYAISMWHSTSKFRTVTMFEIIPLQTIIHPKANAWLWRFAIPNFTRLPPTGRTICIYTNLDNTTALICPRLDHNKPNIYGCMFYMFLFNFCKLCIFLLWLCILIVTYFLFILFWLCCSVYCLCLNVYCTTASRC